MIDQNQDSMHFALDVRRVYLISMKHCFDLNIEVWAMLMLLSLDRVQLQKIVVEDEAEVLVAFLDED